MKKNKQKKEIDVGVIWCCPSCGAYNLHPLDWTTFNCLKCGYELYAEASAKIERVMGE